MIWLGDKAGYLSDWVTQQWVRSTGRRVLLANYKWLDGPIGNTKIIGKDFFTEYSRDHGLEVVDAGSRGLMLDFASIAKNADEVSAIAPIVQKFYEHTSEFELDAWAEWHGFFKPFGTALAILFSRRLQQLNIPLSSMDSSKGMTSNVLQMWDRGSGQLALTAWVRELHATGNVIYAGCYSVCSVPGYDHPCVKVVFPLPNGNAIVIMKPEFSADGLFSLTSSGRGFGDPGFYFVVHGDRGEVWARYVKAMTEKITVYSAENQSARADHVLWFFGKQFLRLHYRMRPIEEARIRH